MSAPAIKGPWQQPEIDRFLSRADYPLRLACNAEDGCPRVVSLWYLYRQSQLLCVTHRESQIARLLRRDPRVGFEVSPNEPPYHGVRGQGLAELEPLDDESTLESLLQHYLGSSDNTLGQWLLSRSEEELLISVTPSRMFSWDYRERMADAIEA